MLGELWLPEGWPRHRQVNVERHARSVMFSVLGSMQAHLQWADAEDLLSHLIATTWQLSLVYDPAKDKNPNFESWSRHILKNRVTDWYRNHIVDKRYEYRDREGNTFRDAIAFPASLDAPVGARSDDGDLRLADVVGLHESDDASNGHEDMERLVAERDRFRARDLEVLRRGLSEKSAA